MSTIIWCDHVKHVVTQSRSEVADLIDAVQADLNDPTQGGYVSGGGAMKPQGFAYFDIEEVRGVGGQQRALNVRLISSFEAAPGSAI
jgi:hypothetical protein